MDRNYLGYGEAKCRVFTKEYMEAVIADLYRLVREGMEGYIGLCNGAMEQYEKMHGQ